MLRRQSRYTNLKMKGLHGLLRIRTVKPNVSSVGLSSERNRQKHHTSLCEKVTSLMPEKSHERNFSVPSGSAKRMYASAC